jgi:DNA-binding PucR family transcriptional regulator
MGGEGRSLFLPQDESSAWAWLPLGGRKVATLKAEPAPGADGVRFALGSVGGALAGFRRTHRQALGAHAVALAAGPAARPVTCFSDVAPLALMAGSVELVRDWVGDTLGVLADADEHNARLRDTLRIFLRENGSYKATAEQLTLHKNTVQYRVRKAEEALGVPLPDNRLDVELALLATHWLGAAVLRATDDTRA